jgi:hypothetical protein
MIRLIGCGNNYGYNNAYCKIIRETPTTVTCRMGIVEMTYRKSDGHATGQNLGGWHDLNQISNTQVIGWQHSVGLHHIAGR